jgi:hypothetical protein
MKFRERKKKKKEKQRISTHDPKAKKGKERSQAEKSTNSTLKLMNKW